MNVILGRYAPVSVRKVYYQSGISVMLSCNINSPVVCKQKII